MSFLRTAALSWAIKWLCRLELARGEGPANGGTHAVPVYGAWFNHWPTAADVRERVCTAPGRH